MKKPLSVLAAAFLAILAFGCEEMPITPTVGPGDELEATIGGEHYDFTLNEGESTYNTTTLFGRFSGSTDEIPVRTLTIRFAQIDIDNTEFPVSLTDPDAHIVLTVGSMGGPDTTYSCVAGSGDCHITLIASDGEIVDGTFSATLGDDPSDPENFIEISEGEFSVKLTRD